MPTPRWLGGRWSTGSPSNSTRPSRLPDEAGHDPQQRGFAAAGGPEQRDQFAAGDIEIDVADRDEIVESMGNVVEGQPVSTIRRHDERHAIHDPAGH